MVIKLLSDQMKFLSNEILFFIRSFKIYSKVSKFAMNILSFHDYEAEIFQIFCFTMILISKWRFYTHLHFVVLAMYLVQLILKWIILFRNLFLKLFSRSSSNISKSVSFKINNLQSVYFARVLCSAGIFGSFLNKQTKFRDRQTELV